MRRQHIRHRVIPMALVTAAALVAAISLGGCREEKAPAETPPTPVTVATATTYNGMEGVN
jgi:nitrous oxide reductase accessory protein NosL